MDILDGMKLSVYLCADKQYSDMNLPSIAIIHLNNFTVVIDHIRDKNDTLGSELLSIYGLCSVWTCAFAGVH